MADFDLSGMLGMDASEFVSGADEAADAMEGVQDTAEDTEDVIGDIDTSGLAAGGGMAAGGAGAQKMMDDTQGLRESLGRTAVSTEMTRDETTKMAQEMSNATYPMEDAVSTMDTLARQGVESEDRLRDLATASDNLADATGHSADEIASDLGPAVKGLDGDLGALEEDADTFTTVLRDTTLESKDLGKVLERSRDDLDEMGLSADEASQMVGAYADKTGKSGRQAARDFSSAVSDAEGDSEALKDELGLTEDKIDDFSGEMEENQGATDEYAEAANESVTTMDTLGDMFDDVKLATAEAIGPVDAIAPAMQTAGIAAMTMSTINFSAVIPSFIGVMSAAAPVVIPLLAIAAAVGALYYAWENNLFGIRDIADDVFGTLTGWADDFKDAFPASFDEAVDLVMGVFEGWDPRPPLRNAADAMWDALPSWEDFEALGSDLVDGLMGAFLKWHPYGILWDKREEIFAALPSYDDFEALGGDLITGLVNGWYGAVGTVRSGAGWLSEWVWSAVPSYDDFETTGGNLVTGVVNGLYGKYSTIKSGAGWLSEWVKSGIPDWEWAKQQGRNFIVGFVNGLYSRDGYLRDGAKWIGNVIDAWTPGSDAEKGPLSNLTAWGEAVPETMAEGVASNTGALASATDRMAAGAAPGAAGAGGRAGGMGVGAPVVEMHVADSADDLTKVLFNALEDDIETTIRRREQAQHRRSKRVNRRDG